MDEERAILALAALAQPTRLATFRLLARREPVGVPAGEIARQVGVPQNTMSAHLNILTRANLAFGTRQSRSIVYRADLSGLRATIAFLLEDCCGGRADACRPLLDLLVAATPPDGEAFDRSATTSPSMVATGNGGPA